jgi:tetratricopeptide (TPR) repeat protein
MSIPQQKELTSSERNKKETGNLQTVDDNIESDEQRPQDAVDQGIIVEAINSSIQHELSETEPSNLDEIAKELTATQTEGTKRETEKKQEEIPSAQPFNKWLNIGATSGQSERPEIGHLVDLFTSGRPDTQKQFFSASKMAAKSLIDDGEIVTETLANIYADQGNYEKAISSYQTLILKFPEKSALFAARMEELKKLNS